MYTIVRFYSDGRHEYGADGLTEEEAKAICSTGAVGNGWIDIFTKEKQTRRKFSQNFVTASYNAHLNYLAACLWVKENGVSAQGMNVDVPINDTVTISYKKLCMVLDKAERYENMKKKLPDLIDDLGWEYDRMSDDGKITLNKIAKVMGLPKFTDNAGL